MSEMTVSKDKHFNYKWYSSKAHNSIVSSKLKVYVWYGCEVSAICLKSDTHNKGEFLHTIRYYQSVREQLHIYFAKSLLLTKDRDE